VIKARAHPCDASLIASTRTDASCTAHTKSLLLLATIIGSGMAFIDSEGVGVAMPVIGTDLHAGLPAMQWVVNAYVLATAALTLIGGAAGDRFGRKRIFVAGILVFIVASVACGLAMGPISLIAARAVQGIGGALMIPNSLALIGATFDEHEKGKAIGTWAGATSIAGALGPVLGGWLTDTISWRGIFFINLPFAVLAMLIARTGLPESRDPQAPARLDWAGAAFVAIGLAALAFALIQSSELGWRNPEVFLFGIGGLCVLGAFLWTEARGSAPMVPLGLFRSSRFGGINLLTLLLYGALSGGFFLVPFDLIRVQSYSAAEAGAAFLPFPLVMIALSRWSGGLLDRFGARPPLIIGPAITAVGLGWLALAGLGGSYWLAVLPPMLIMGLGMAVSVAPLTAAVMSAVPGRQVGVASGVNNAVTDIASLLAVAVFGAVGLSVFDHMLDRELGDLGSAPELTEAIAAVKRTLAGSDLPGDLPAGTRAALQTAISGSFAASFRLLMLGACGLAALSALSAAVTIRREPRS